MTEPTRVIFVDIGIALISELIAPRVMIFLDEDETPTQAAKLLRKRICDELNNRDNVGVEFKPSDLYFNIYNNTEECSLSIISDNSPLARKDYYVRTL